MGKSLSLVVLLFFCLSVPVYAINPVTLPFPPPSVGPSPIVTRDAIPVEGEWETHEAGGVDVRASDEGGIVDAEDIEIVPPNAWSFQFSWELDVNYWREMSSGLVNRILCCQTEFMSKFPLSLFSDCIALLEELDGETAIAKFAGPVTIARGVVLNLSVPDTVQTMFSMIRALNGFLIMLFGTWSLAHKFISFGGS